MSTHKYTPAQCRFIMILRHHSPGRLWSSIANSFNSAFSTNLTTRCIIEKHCRERQKLDSFNAYLQQNNSVPPDYQEEYEDIIRRYGAPTGQQHRQVDRDSVRTPRFLYTPSQIRFVVILEHLTADQSSVPRTRWTEIATLFNERFNKQITYDKISSLCRRARGWNGPVFKSLQETGKVPDEFQQEYEDIMRAYETAKATRFFESSISNSGAQAEGGIVVNDDFLSRPTTDNGGLYQVSQSSISQEHISNSSTTTQIPPAPTPFKKLSQTPQPTPPNTLPPSPPTPLPPPEREFLLLLTHFTFKTPTQLTACHNNEFHTTHTPSTLHQQYQLDHKTHPLSIYLESQARVPPELSAYLEYILQKYGVGQIDMDDISNAAAAGGGNDDNDKYIGCEEFYHSHHSGPIRPCVSHATTYHICESCKTTAFNIATTADILPPPATDNEHKLVRPASNEWLCLECQLSHRISLEKHQPVKDPLVARNDNGLFENNKAPSPPPLPVPQTFTTCNEFYNSHHSGPIHPCASHTTLHTTRYAICESCKEYAFNIATTELTPTPLSGTLVGDDDGEHQSRASRLASDQWLCLDCQISYRLG